MAAFQFPMIKEAIGWSAATAIFAVHLAESGFKSYLAEGTRPPVPDVFPPTPFDSAAALADPFVAGLGERFEAARTYLKPFSCCRFTHAAAAEFLTLLEGGLDPAEVTAVRVGTHRQAVFLGERRPPSLEHAQYSFPFVLGALAVDRDAGPAQIAEGRLADPAILDFAARVTVEFDEEMADHYPEHYASRLRIELAGGGEVVSARAVAPGDTEEPLSEDRLLAKFGTLAEPILGTSTSDRLLELLAAPDRTTNRELLENLAPRADQRSGAAGERRATDAY
jgi:2-methylcitrate dehydratase PrpD